MRLELAKIEQYLKYEFKLFSNPRNNTNYNLEDHSCERFQIISIF